MADPHETPTATPDATPPPSDPNESLSLFEHAKRFGPNREDSPDPAPPAASTQAVETPPAELPDTETDSATGPERDEQGRFVKGSHRARKHDAQVRIDDLTRKLRETEAALAAVQTPPPPSLPRVEPPPPPAPRPPEAPKVEPPKARPKPDDFQDYGEYIDALTDWKTETFWHQKEAERQQQEQLRAVEREQERLRTDWTAKVNAAKAEMADFEQVALLAPTPIPPGSLIDAWILEHPSGARVLYELHKNPTTLQALLTQPPIVQVEQLALLAHRLTSPRGVGAVTGAPAAQSNGSGPKPPTPVRTTAVSSGTAPPDEETLSLRQHAKLFPVKRRH